MKLNKTLNVTRGSFFGLFNKAVMTLFPFVIRTVTIKFLGQNYLGLSSLFTAVLQVISLANLGFGSAIVYALHKPLADDNYEKVSSLLCLYRRVYDVISFAIMVIGLLTMPFLPYFIKSDCPPDVNLYLLYFIYLINTVSSYQFGAFYVSMLQANQRNDLIYIIYTIFNSAMYTGQILVLIFLKSFYFYAILIPITTALINISISIIVKRKYCYIKSNVGVEDEDKKDLISKTKPLIVHKIGYVLINSLDNIVISIVLGLNVLAVFSNYYYIVTSLTAIIDIFYNSFLGGVGNSLNTEKEEYNFKLFKRITLFFCWVTGLFTTILFVSFQSFMRFWVGESMMLNISSVILFSLYFYSWQFRVPGMIYEDAKGLWGKDIAKPIIGIVANLCLNFLLVYLIGVNGAIISTIIIMFFIYFPFETHIVSKNVFHGKKKSIYFSNVIYLLIMVSSCVLSFFLTKIIPIEGNILSFFIYALIAFFVYNLIFVIFMFKNEHFKFYIQKIASFFKKRKSTN